MGKPGPKPTDKAVLAARGSWRAKIREKPQCSDGDVAALYDWVEKIKRIRGRRPSMKAPDFRWQQILRDIPGYDPIKTSCGSWFDAKEAEAAVQFIEKELVFIEGERAGQPFKLEGWQKAIVANIFGWKRGDGTRRYRKVAIFVARKNGKTPLIAAILLYLGFCDCEPGSQIYSAAAEREQASLVFRHAKSMAERNPILKAHCQIHKSFKSIEFWPDDINMATYRALSADAETKHGLGCQAFAVDELHAQPNRELVDVLETSMGSRRQPLAMYITTMGFDKKTICGEIYEYACKVRDGVVDDSSFLPVIYEAGADDVWTDENVWKKANPNLGVSVKIDFLRSECKKAQGNPAYENTFRRLYLNQWTESETRWIGPEKWDAIGEPYSERDFAGMECYGGLDLSTTTDLSSLSIVVPYNEKLYLLAWCWMARERARERQERDRVPYMQWAKEGWLELTDGNVIDYSYIRRKINELGKIYCFRDIGVDRWNATQLIIELQSDGFTITPFGQGFRDMTAPAKEFEKMVIGQTLRHNQNPIMAWAVRNVMVEHDAAGNIKPSKSKSTERIDPVVATIMAIGRWQAKPVIPQDPYVTRGFLSL